MGFLQARVVEWVIISSSRVSSQFTALLHCKPILQHWAAWEALEIMDANGIGGASQVPLVVKNPPANTGDERDAGSIPSWEDPLEKEMATHSSHLAWRIPCTEEPGGLQSTELQRVGYNWSNLAQRNSMSGLLLQNKLRHSKQHCNQVLSHFYVFILSPFP